MKWAPETTAELCALALTCRNAEEIAEKMQKTPAGIRWYAHRHQINLPDEPDLHGRWAKLIGPMKAQLRAEIAAGIAAE